MEDKRFYIDNYYIYDNWKDNKKMNWEELCDTLNELDKLADKNLNEYRYIVKLEYELQGLKWVLKEVLSIILNIRKDMERMVDLMDKK